MTLPQGSLKRLKRFLGNPVKTSVDGRLLGRNVRLGRAGREDVRDVLVWLLPVGLGSLSGLRAEHTALAARRFGLDRPNGLHVQAASLTDRSLIVLLVDFNSFMIRVETLLDRLVRLAVSGADFRIELLIGRAALFITSARLFVRFIIRGLVDNGKFIALGSWRHGFMRNVLTVNAVHYFVLETTLLVRLQNLLTPGLSHLWVLEGAVVGGHRGEVVGCVSPDHVV